MRRLLRCSWDIFGNLFFLPTPFYDLLQYRTDVRFSLTLMIRITPIQTGTAQLKRAQQCGQEGRSAFERKIDIFRDTDGSSRTWLR